MQEVNLVLHAGIADIKKPARGGLLDARDCYQIWAVNRLNQPCWL